MLRWWARNLRLKFAIVAGAALLTFGLYSFIAASGTSASADVSNQSTAATVTENQSVNSQPRAPAVPRTRRSRGS